MHVRNRRVIIRILHVMVSPMTIWDLPCGVEQLIIILSFERGFPIKVLLLTNVYNRRVVIRGFYVMVSPYANMILPCGVERLIIILSPKRGFPYKGFLPTNDT